MNNNIKISDYKLRYLSAAFINEKSNILINSLILLISQWIHLTTDLSMLVSDLNACMCIEICVKVNICLSFIC